MPRRSVSCSASTRLDRALALAVAVVAVVEVSIRPDISSRPAAVMVGLALVVAMLWRTTRPLHAVVVAFGTFLVVDVGTLVVEARPLMLYVGLVVPLFAYSLVRFGTTRHVLLGAVALVTEWAVAVVVESAGTSDAVGGLSVLLLAAAVGAAVKYREVARRKEMEMVRLHERAALARDLHDTIAHHVSGIAIQAQAGQVLAGSGDVAGAVAALREVESEAASAMVEMRSLVGLLRGGAQASGGGGLCDLAQLAMRHDDSGPDVTVHIDRPVGDLPPAVSAALYRVAQESITNARRHARRARTVRVEVTAAADRVDLVVHDDGERHPSVIRHDGYGLVGMRERVSLLGGTMTAGAAPGGGWTVCASVPRELTTR